MHLWVHRVRMHYGHPDVFDRLFHISRGGISKPSRGINLSEDIFAGLGLTSIMVLVIFKHIMCSHNDLGLLVPE